MKGCSLLGGGRLVPGANLTRGNKEKAVQFHPGPQEPALQDLALPGALSCRLNWSFLGILVQKMGQKHLSSIWKVGSLEPQDDNVISRLSYWDKRNLR